jgi:ribosomal protection tetracycline resistance protein
VSTLNLGILAHVDAGKTSLTERLLYSAGVIDQIGSVDHGDTQTDTLALERQRGITIKSAVVSFVINDVTINLIDTPGHPDFIAEVDRILSVLDGAVLVVSAVEGVQAQTRVLMRALQRLRIPTLIFVNKIDRGGAGYGRVLDAVATRLSPAIVAMCSTAGLGSRGASVAQFGPTDDAFVGQLVDLLASEDEALLAAYVEDENAVSYRRLREVLATQTKRARAHPVFFGSAITGAGVDALIAGITELLPATDGHADGPTSATVFKVERGPAGEKIAYARMFSGRIRIRDRLPLRGEETQKITAIRVFEDGATVRRESIVAGEIAKLWGLGEVQIGDPIGASRIEANGHYFAPPSLESVVVPSRRADKGAVHVALAQLAEQDPLINLRQDDIRQEIYVSLYGEVQKEVIQATLADDFGLDVTFRETTTICVERLVGIGAAVEILDDPDNPFNAGVGLRIEPAAIESGVEFRLGVELGSLPLPFLKAVEQTVRAALRQGLSGWEVIDCTVTLTDSGYIPPQGKRGQAFDASISTTAGDFRHLVPLVLMRALRQAGTTVHEPMHRFRLEIPSDLLGTVLPVLARLQAVPHLSTIHGSAYVIEGDVPAARVHDLELALPALTSGEGVLENAFDHYRQIRGEAPTRPRTDHNPLDRKEYLLHVLRRV